MSPKESYRSLAAKMNARVNMFLKTECNNGALGPDGTRPRNPSPPDSSQNETNTDEEGRSTGGSLVSCSQSKEAKTEKNMDHNNDAVSTSNVVRKITLAPSQR